MKTPILALVVVATVGICSSPVPQRVSAQQILLDESFWGPDYPAALQALMALRDAGETNAYIFASRIAGGSGLAAETARSRAETVRARMARPRPLPPQFAKLQKPGAATAPLRVDTAQLIDEDGSHVVAALPKAQLLAGGLTVEMVRGRFGEPERVIEQAIQNRTERRPVILKLHVYAGGAIAFAESNMSEPNVIERVVVDLSRVVPLLTR